MNHEHADHAQRVASAVALLKPSSQAQAVPLALSKSTSNLFRDRSQHRCRRVDLHQFDHVVGADIPAGWVDVEGMMTYEALVDWCLLRDMMPAVVPQLKTITVGGAAAGVGIEATSFRRGLVHDTVREMEVLLPDGQVVVCSPDNEFSDLFYGFPNSYGTLGYALRLRIDMVPVQPFVHIQHHRLVERADFIDVLIRQCGGDADFVDAVAFAENDYVVTTARLCPSAAWLSDYTYEQIYWKSLRERDEDYLTIRDYLWRWDTDWFWCSQRFGAQHAFVRHLLGRKRLNSRTYTRWMRVDSRWQLSRRWARIRGVNRESIIQDVDLPSQHAQEFLAFLQREIGIAPIWVCPVRGEVGERIFPLYRLAHAALYVNFGFWDVIESRGPADAAHFNRRIEQEVMRLGGIKSLYSDSYFSREVFKKAYGQQAYERLKDRYDPGRLALDLYDKCVLRR